MIFKVRAPFSTSLVFFRSARRLICKAASLPPLVALRKKLKGAGPSRLSWPWRRFFNGRRFLDELFALVAASLR
jgi:hypothetical protein